ncbi:MAG: h16, partial [Burkholderiaceae bacterium]|nr:h16 [Burkholderiaceae bacterium]
MAAVRRCLAVFVLLLLALTARAEDRPIRILVGFPPGGESDLVARLLADGMRVALGVPVIVENKPGASGMLAAEALKAAAP